MNRKLLLSVLAFAALVAFSSVSISGAATRKAAGGEPGMGPAHWYAPGAFGTWGNVRAAPRAGKSALAVDPLTNTGPGEVMPTTRTHLIFWLPSGFHYSSSVGDGNYESQMIKYFQDVGGSQILNTTTQYTGTNGTPADTSTFIDSIVDTTAFPHTGADVAHAVTQGDLNQEVFNQIGAHSGWNLGLSDMYFVFLPNGLVDCNNALTSCNTNAYCAYHTYGYSGGTDDAAHDFIWADIPDNRSPGTTLGGCGRSNVTGDESADTTLSSVEHEHLEAVSDPRLNAWMDSTGAENGDKCNREMGVADSSATIANNYLGDGAADLFRIQREWSNAVSGCAASYTTTGSGVESPVPSGGDATASVVEPTIPGNNGDQLHYSISFHNPSNQDDVYSVVATVGYAGGVSGTTTFNLGDLAPHQTATRSFTGTVSGGPLAAGTVLTTSVTFAFADSTGTAQPALSRSATSTVSNAPPALSLPGAQTQDFNDPLTFGISATDADAGDAVSLSASGLPAGLSFTDNGDRTGTVSGTITAAPGPYFVTFSANDHHQLAPTSGTVLIVVTREETTTVYNGVTGDVLDGSTVTLSGLLREDGVTPLAGKSLTLTLGSGGSTQTCSATTDASGVASCAILVNQPVGPHPVSAAFAGDTLYLPSSGADSVVVYTAKSLKQDTLAQAIALLPGATKQEADRLRDVIKKLNDSLDPSLWVDGNHVSRKHGDKVFSSEKDAVGKLVDLIRKGSLPDATLQGMIDKLVHADRILAEGAIAGSSDAHKTAEAQEELVRAADDALHGRFGDAIEHYRNAWKKVS